jgi:hypothetical protein
MLYTCQACKQGRHHKCEKGTPAAKGAFGGSLCQCHHIDHSGGIEGASKRINKFLKEVDNYRKYCETPKVQKDINKHTY